MLNLKIRCVNLIQQNIGFVCILHYTPIFCQRPEQYNFRLVNRTGKFSLFKNFSQKNMILSVFRKINFLNNHKNITLIRSNISVSKLNIKFFIIHLIFQNHLHMMSYFHQKQQKLIIKISFTNKNASLINFIWYKLNLIITSHHT